MLDRALTFRGGLLGAVLALPLGHSLREKNKTDSSFFFCPLCALLISLWLVSDGGRRREEGRCRGRRYDYSFFLALLWDLWTLSFFFDVV